MSQTTQNKNEQNILLFVNIKECIKRMKNKNKSSHEMMLTWLRAHVAYFENIQFALINKNLIKIVDEMTIIFNRNQNKMKKNNVIIRNNITKLNNFFKFSFFTNKTNQRNWIAITSTTFQTFKITTNKNTKIIMRLNDNEKKREMNEWKIKCIVKNINICITKKIIQIKNIRTIKKFFNENFAIHVVNAIKIEKLKNNNA